LIENETYQVGDKLDLLANKLIEKETLEEYEVRELLGLEPEKEEISGKEEPSGEKEDVV
jgi:hypothetical protein